VAHWIFAAVFISSSASKPPAIRVPPAHDECSGLRPV
jgi:hypothetical protein